jgi:[ribosomal protein S5]-alanine N-acetyltransferase
MELVYESERLQLKVFTIEDIELAKTFWGDSEVMQHCAGAVPHNLLAKVLDAYQKSHYEKGISVYAVVEKNSGKVIGAAGYNVRNTVEKIELVFHFAKVCWGKGYATEAANACVEIAKQNKDIKILYASADSENMNSIKILQKLGFQFIEMKWFDDTNQEEPYFEFRMK